MFFAGFPTVVVVVVIDIVVVGVVCNLTLGRDACSSVDERQTRCCFTDIFQIWLRGKYDDL